MSKRLVVARPKVPSTVTDGADRGEVWFIGEDAAGSRSLGAVPRWSEVLGHPSELRAVSVDRHATSETYIRVFDEMRGDPRVTGAVVTGHKVGMYQAVAGDLAWASPVVRRLQEVNVLAVRPHGVEGHATDVDSIGAEVDRLWPAPGATALCLGGGGSARALCLHLTRRPVPPVRVLVSERDGTQAAGLRRLFDAEADGCPIEVLVGRGPWDDLVGALAPGSLVVNATGLGKSDTRSPLSAAATFPERAVVWDLNYRGPLPFVHRARRQASARRLVVEDGTRLFALGWLAALGAVFGVETAPHEKAFVRIAEAVRP